MYILNVIRSIKYHRIIALNTIVKKVDSFTIIITFCYKVDSQDIKITIANKYLFSV